MTDPSRACWKVEPIVMVRLQEVASVVVTYFDLKWMHKVDLGVPLVGGFISS
jgi:hypothetical protein